METRASYVTVGAFVMVCLLGLTVAMLWLTGAQYRQEFIYFRTFFTGAVTGLGRGTTVRYNGIEVGNVTELAFDPADPRRVIVTLQTTPTLKLHTDFVASIEQQGLTGGTYVEIEGGTPDSPILTAQPGQAYPVIPSRVSTLQELSRTAPRLIERFTTVGDRVVDLLNDDNRAAFTEIMKSLRQTTALINAHSEELGATLANLKVASASINKTLTTADTMLSSADTAMKSANKAVGTLDTTLNSANTTAKKLGQLSDDTDKMMTSQVSQLITQARTLMSSLTRLSNDLERDPSKLLYGEQRQGYAPR